MVCCLVVPVVYGYDYGRHLTSLWGCRDCAGKVRYAAISSRGVVAVATAAAADVAADALGRTCSVSVCRAEHAIRTYVKTDVNLVA